MKKTFKVAQVKDLLNQVHKEEITFSRFVEILNEQSATKKRIEYRTPCPSLKQCASSWSKCKEECYRGSEKQDWHLLHEALDVFKEMPKEAVQLLFGDNIKTVWIADGYGDGIGEHRGEEYYLLPGRGFVIEFHDGGLLDVYPSDTGIVLCNETWPCYGAGEK